jgi:hypothetical protein
MNPRKPLAVAAAILGAVAGAGVLQGIAQVITAPAGAACIATAGESCSGAAALSNGGSAQGTVAVSKGGSAEGIFAAAVNGTACGDTWWAGPSAAIAIGGSGAYDCGGWTQLAIATQGSSDACDEGPLLFPSTWVAVAVNLTGSAEAYCPNQGYYPIDGVAVAPLGSATTDCYDDGVAISVVGPASGANCLPGAWSAAVSGTNTAWGSQLAASGTNSATAAHSTTPDTQFHSLAVSGTGDATAGMVAVSATGSTYACGGPVTVSESVGGDVGTGSEAGSCSGGVPLPGGGAQTQGTSVH